LADEVEFDHIYIFVVSVLPKQIN